MRGPKPEPTAVKKRKGNPGKRPLNDREPIPHGGKLICPQFLTGAARRKWFALRPILETMGTLKPVDQDILAAYCTEYGRWVDAERILKKVGPIIQTKNGNLIQNPLVGVSNRAQELMLKYGAELGIGAATRSRISVEKEGGEDVLEALLRGDRTN